MMLIEAQNGLRNQMEGTQEGRTWCLLDREANNKTLYKPEDFLLFMFED